MIAPEGEFFLKIANIVSQQYSTDRLLQQYSTERLFNSIKSQLVQKKELITNYSNNCVILKISNGRCVKVSGDKKLKDQMSLAQIISEHELDNLLLDFKKTITEQFVVINGTIKLYYVYANGHFLYKSYTFAEEKHIPVTNFMNVHNRDIIDDQMMLKEDIVNSLMYYIRHHFRYIIENNPETELILHTRNCLPQRIIMSKSVADLDLVEKTNSSFQVDLDEDKLLILAELLKARIYSLSLQHIGTLFIRIVWQNQSLPMTFIKVFDNKHYYGDYDLLPIESAITNK